MGTAVRSHVPAGPGDCDGVGWGWSLCLREGPGASDLRAELWFLQKRLRFLWYLGKVSEDIGAP